MADENAELESFRRQWRAEVSARRKGSSSNPTTLAPGAAPLSAAAGPDGKIPRSAASKKPAGPVSSPAGDRATEDNDEVGSTTHAFPDLEERGTRRILGTERDESGAIDDVSVRESDEEPRSALEHYEKAVERETQGSLGDSLNHYRKAYRMDSRVDQTYKNKYFPPTKTAGKNPNPSNAAATVPNPAHHSLHGHTSVTPSSGAAGTITPSQTISDLITEFSTLSIPAAEPPTSSSSAPRPCPLATLPSEILSDVLLQLAILDVASFARLARVCKRLAYLVATEDRIWKRVACGPEYGFGAMHYRYDCTIRGHPLHRTRKSVGRHHGRRRGRRTSPAPTFLPMPYIPPPHPTYQHLFRYRPRLRFGGCYISTVNYVRPGASSPTMISWNTPVHIVTYYRYLRFFRDGTCLSLLTTTEPSDVVHHLTSEAQALHASGAGAGLPSAVVKSALRGRWRLIGDEEIPGHAPPIQAEPDDDDDDDDNDEPDAVLDPNSSTSEGHTKDEAAAKPGDVLIETEGVGDPNKYTYKMHLCLRSVSAVGPAGGAGPAVVNNAAATRSRGGHARNTKLVWKGFWSHNRLTDDWAEFGLRNDRAFLWHRVRSYGNA